MLDMDFQSEQLVGRCGNLPWLRGMNASKTTHMTVSVWLPVCLTACLTACLSDCLLFIKGAYESHAYESGPLMSLSLMSQGCLLVSRSWFFRLWVSSLWFSAYDSGTRYARIFPINQLGVGCGIKVDFWDNVFPDAWGQNGLLLWRFKSKGVICCKDCWPLPSMPNWLSS